MTTTPTPTTPTTSSGPFTLPTPIPEHKTDTHAQILETLTQLPPNERTAAFAQNFTPDERPLHTLGTITEHPDLTQTYPQFETEIRDAYRAHTLFTAEVQTPYDTATDAFSPENFSDCGRILVPDVPFLKNSDAATRFNTPVDRVRFDIRSPFSNVLFQVFVTLQRGEGGEGAKIAASVVPVEFGRYEVLRGYLEQVCQAIGQQGVTGRPSGLSYQNLEVIASYIVPQKVTG